MILIGILQRLAQPTTNVTAYDFCSKDPGCQFSNCKLSYLNGKHNCSFTHCQEISRKDLDPVPVWLIQVFTKAPAPFPTEIHNKSLSSGTFLIYWNMVLWYWSSKRTWAIPPLLYQTVTDLNVQATFYLRLLRGLFLANCYPTLKDLGFCFLSSLVFRHHHCTEVYSSFCLIWHLYSHWSVKCHFFLIDCTDCTCTWGIIFDSTMSSRTMFRPCKYKVL